MLRWVFALTLITTLTQAASAQFLQEKWGAIGLFVATGHMLPGPNVQMLIDYYIPGGTVVVDPVAGPVYTLPSPYASPTNRNILIRDFDLDGQDEILVVVGPLGPPAQSGMFDLWPTPGPTWERTDFFNIGSLESANLTGSRRDVLVIGSGDLIVYDSSNGAQLFQWVTEHPGSSLQVVIGYHILDVDGDGRDEIIVQAEEVISLIKHVYVIEYTGTVGVGTDQPILEARLLTARSVPNPSQGPTQVEFSLGVRSQVTVRVFDAAGRLVKTVLDEAREAGNHKVTWDGTDGAGRAASSGTYFCEVTAGSERIARKMVRIR